MASEEDDRVRRTVFAEARLQFWTA
jgi:hypothetical protein